MPVTQQASALLVAVEEALSQAVHAAPRRPLAARVLNCSHPPHGLVHLVAPAASVEEGGGREGEGDVQFTQFTRRLAADTFESKHPRRIGNTCQ